MFVGEGDAAPYSPPRLGEVNKVKEIEKVQEEVKIRRRRRKRAGGCV